MKFKLFIIVLLISINAFADWEIFSPDSVYAYSINFNLDNKGRTAICHSMGVSLYDPVEQIWSNHYKYDATDAAWLNGDSILVSLGVANSYSDGIYSLNPETGNYSIIYWKMSPYFFKKDPLTNRIFCGGSRGLSYSDDGYNWSYYGFTGNDEVRNMAIHGLNYVINIYEEPWDIYFSIDAGEQWSPSINEPKLLDFVFDNNGDLYGLVSGYTGASGIWFSDNHGENWENKCLAFGMNCLGKDAMGNIFIGFSNEPYSSGGVAIWDKTNDTYILINEGLPEHAHVSKITYNPAMSALTLFCCTNSGVYVNYDYVGITRSEASKINHLNVYPVPVTDELYIETGTPYLNGFLQLFDSKGILIDHLHIPKNHQTISVDCSNYTPGIYFISIQSDQNRYISKFIKH